MTSRCVNGSSRDRTMPKKKPAKPRPAFVAQLSEVSLARLRGVKRAKRKARKQGRPADEPL